MPSDFLQRGNQAASRSPRRQAGADKPKAFDEHSPGSARRQSELEASVDDAWTRGARAGGMSGRSSTRSPLPKVSGAWTQLEAQLIRVWPGVTVQRQAGKLKKQVAHYAELRQLVEDHTGRFAPVLDRHATAAELEAALRKLVSLLEKLDDGIGGEAPFTVQVAAGPAGGVTRVEEGADPIDTVRVERSRGVLVGDRGKVAVTHHCKIERPTIELATLTVLDPETVQAAWSERPFAYDINRTVETMSTDVSSGLFIRIRHSDGVVVGDDNDVQVHVQHRIRGCRLNAVALLSNERVLRALIVYRQVQDDTECADAADAAFAELSRQATRAANQLCPDAVAPNWPDLVTAARPDLRRNGHVIEISDAQGAAVGVGTGVTSTTKSSTSNAHAE
jgi:hypothetical protein